MMHEGNYSDEKALMIEETYNKLRKLLDTVDSPDTQHEDVDPSALADNLIKHFYSQLKF
jgi:hypothetical protein